MLVWLQWWLGNLRLVLPRTEKLNTSKDLAACLRYLLCDYESRMRSFSVVTCIRLVLTVKKEKKNAKYEGYIRIQKQPLQVEG